MSADVVTNNGIVPELQRKARQKRAAEVRMMHALPGLLHPSSLACLIRRLNHGADSLCFQYLLPSGGLPSLPGRLRVPFQEREPAASHCGPHCEIQPRLNSMEAVIWNRLARYCYHDSPTSWQDLSRPLYPQYVLSFFSCMRIFCFDAPVVLVCHLQRCHPLVAWPCRLHLCLET